MEDLFGTDAWYELKETTSLNTWKKYLLRALQSYLVAAKETIEVFDKGWWVDFEANNLDGQSAIKNCSDFDQAISLFCATIARQSYIQMGRCPRRPPGRKSKFGLQKHLWNLSSLRSVQYIRSKKQIANAFEARLRKEIGFDGYLDATSAHRRSGTRLEFEEWYKANFKHKTPRSSLRGASISSP